MPANPAYPRLSRSRPAPRPGIVHFGPGAFFRALVAVSTQQAMAARPGDWGIVAVSLKSAAARDALMPQGCAFTAVSLGPGGNDRQIIGSIVRVLVAPDDPAAVLSQLCRRETRVVSLTITEKGYGLIPGSHWLDRANADVAHDLANPGAPRTAAGFIVAALARRRADGLPGFTVLSCDNLPANGQVMRAAVMAHAAAHGGALAEWIAANARFPSTMVDRITPAATPEDRRALAAAAGYDDRACVFHEPFRQWVIEDDFVAGARPAWEAGGAEFVADVARHETMKLRCLNGAHSALAYLGLGAGKATIADAVADPALAAYCRALWGEIVPTIEPPAGADPGAYCNGLLNRFANPAIRHRTAQIATDGSQKLPQRLLATISDNLAAGRGIGCLSLAVAAWVHHAAPAAGSAAPPPDLNDPLARRLATAAVAADPVAAFLDISDVFGPALARDKRFRTALSRAHAAIAADGARAAARRAAAVAGENRGG